MKKEYCVGIKIINCFYVEAENRDEAEQIVREYDHTRLLTIVILISNMLILRGMEKSVMEINRR